MSASEAPQLLLIEDNPRFADKIKTLLSDYTVHHARNSRESKELLRKNKFNLIIADLVLNETNRHILADVGEWLNIADDAPQIPVIVITGHIDVTVDELMYAINHYGGRMVGWHKKPNLASNPRDLVENIHKALREHGTRTSETFASNGVRNWASRFFIFLITAVLAFGIGVAAAPQELGMRLTGLVLTFFSASLAYLVAEWEALQNTPWFLPLLMVVIGSVVALLVPLLQVIGK